MFILIVLMCKSIKARQQMILISRSNFSNIINAHSTQCIYRDNINSGRYTRDCPKVYDNTWNGIQVNQNTDGGAAHINYPDGYVEILRNSFTRCKARSGGACALSLVTIHFNLNTVDRCETVSTSKGDGAIYIYSNFNRQIALTAGFTQYLDCNFLRGGGLETSCLNIYVKLLREVYTRCNGRNIGGAVHLNNQRGKNEIEDCSFIQCTSNLGGAIGYDCPIDGTSYSVKIMGIFIDGCGGNKGMAVYGSFRRNSNLEFTITKSRNYRSGITRCHQGTELFYINSQQLILNSFDIVNVTGNVLVINPSINGYKINRMNIEDCNLIKCISRSNNDGAIISGNFGVMNINRCRFEEVSFLWSFPDLDEFKVSNSAFRNMNDVDKTRLVTTNVRFSVLFESTTFFNSSMHVGVVTTANTANMNTKFDRCRFESMSRKIFVKMPSNIEVIGCNIDGNALRFSGNSRSLIIRDCILSVSKQGHSLITIESTPRTALSEIRDCTFAVNAGQAVVINGLATETTVKLVRCQFNGNSANPYFSIRGNLILEGNTIRPPTSKTAPLFLFIDGKLIFSNSVKNCVTMPFKRAIAVDNPRLYDQVVDENGRIVERWTEHSNLCFLDSTDQFTFTQDFVPTTRFSISRKFTTSNKFTGSNHFSHSIKFSASRQMTKSDHFTRSNLFSKSMHFPASIGYSASNTMTKSVFFSKSKYYTRSAKFSLSNKMEASKAFSMSDKQYKTIKFSNSGSMSKSNLFTVTNVFSATHKFSRSDEMSASKLFHKTDQMSKSNLLSISNKFDRSIQFSKSKQFFLTNEYSQSNRFTPSDFHGQSHHFTASNKFSKSSQYTASFQFTESEKMTNSEKFGKTNMFTKSVVNTYDFTGSNKMTKSHYFTKSSLFSKTSFFIKTMTMTETAHFSKSNKFSKSEDSEKSKMLSTSSKFTSTKCFSLTETFLESSNFTESKVFTASKTINFGNEDGHIGPQAIVPNKQKKTLNIGIIIAIIIGIVLLALLIIFLLIYYETRKEDDVDDDPYDIETNDGTMSEADSAVTMDNPLYGGELIEEQDPFEFDFFEGGNVYQAGMSL